MIIDWSFDGENAARHRIVTLDVQPIPASFVVWRADDERGELYGYPCGDDGRLILEVLVDGVWVPMNDDNRQPKPGADDELIYPRIRAVSLVVNREIKIEMGAANP